REEVETQNSTFTPVDADILFDDEPTALVVATPTVVAIQTPIFVDENVDVRGFVERWQRRASATREAYEHELLRFGARLGLGGLPDVWRWLAAAGDVEAAEALRAYRDEGTVARATRARRVAAIEAALGDLTEPGVRASFRKVVRPTPEP